MGLIEMELRAKKPWDMLALETLSFLPRSDNGFRHILAVVDVASRWIELLPLRSKDPLELAFAVEQSIFLTFGPPKFILIPSNTEFEGPFPKILKKYDVQKLNAVEANPHLLTFASRCFQSGKRALKLMIREYPTVPWDHLLKHVSYRLRNTAQKDMKSSPQKMVLGFRREMDTEMDEQEQRTTPRNVSNFIPAQRDCKAALAHEREWFQSNMEKFRSLSLSLKAEALRSKMLTDPSASEDRDSFKSSTKRALTGF